VGFYYITQDIKNWIMLLCPANIARNLKIKTVSCYMSIYVDTKLKDVFDPELIGLLKGESCFHI
jgi:hypothetical protein